jgi:hypothetical protein
MKEEGGSVSFLVLSSGIDNPFYVSLVKSKHLKDKIKSLHYRLDPLSLISVYFHTRTKNNTDMQGNCVRGRFSLCVWCMFLPGRIN